MDHADSRMQAQRHARLPAGRRDVTALHLVGALTTFVALTRPDETVRHDVPELPRIVDVAVSYEDFWVAAPVKVPRYSCEVRGGGRSSIINSRCSEAERWA